MKEKIKEIKIENYWNNFVNQEIKRLKGEKEYLEEFKYLVKVDHVLKCLSLPIYYLKKVKIDDYGCFYHIYFFWESYLNLVFVYRESIGNYLKSSLKLKDNNLYKILKENNEIKKYKLDKLIDNFLKDPNIKEILDYKTGMRADFVHKGGRSYDLPEALKQDYKSLIKRYIEKINQVNKAIFRFNQEMVKKLQQN